MKIGILTHYYKSANYGGNLQAYALCKVLEEMGHQPEQLQIDWTGCYRNLLDPTQQGAKQKLKKLIKPVARLLIPRYRKKWLAQKAVRQRLSNAFTRFQRVLIPHSKAVYTPGNIKKSLSHYDVFITGSDQVWNPIWYFKPFFLEFVPSEIPKLSYAASIGQTQLPETVRACYREHLNDFIGVSVREADAVELLEGVAPGEVQWVLDPTMLLSKEQWLEVAEPFDIESPYVFCYFLGNDPDSRSLAKKYAEVKGLTLVNIFNATGNQHSNDIGFGDISLADPHPEAFLGLIQKAAYVFTDSFHATVFSLLFQRQFITFPREGHGQMNSRVIFLTELFDAGCRFCDDLDRLDPETIQAMPEVDYQMPAEKFQKALDRSKEFLQSTLQKAKEMLP